MSAEYSHTKKYRLCGCCAAQQVGQVPHVQRLKLLDTAGLGLTSSLWRFTACHPPFPFALLQIKATRAQNPV